METWIYPLDCDDGSLAILGGKGLNLARLVRAGLPVPGGFVLTTAAYDAFVAHNRLREPIAAALAAGNLADPIALESASAAIRERFSSGTLPAELATGLDTAYAEVGRRPVAVRSSATAEDLPGLSFAGQQDTLLNVVGPDALRDAVVRCWSSLWTARAIGYRARNGIDQASVSLAVIVQEMVESEVSGVLFTANPISGLRDEIVVDAAFGLGEALVSGQVEPDHFVLAPDGTVRQAALGAKALRIHGRPGGGVVQETRDGAAERTLDADQLRALAALGRQVAALYGTPQDIEWALAGGRLVLLQARPITTLFPLPAGAPHFNAFFSFASVQGVFDPLTPLGRDVITHLLNGVIRLLGHRGSPVVATAAQRIYIGYDGLLAYGFIRRIVLGAMQSIDPAAAETLRQLVDAGEFPPPRRLPLRIRLRLVRLLVGWLPVYLRALRDPDAARRTFNASLEALVTTSWMRAAGAADLRQLAKVTTRAADVLLAELFTTFLPRFAPGMMALTLLPRVTGMDALPLTRGLPHNVTTKMDLALWATAQAIRSDDAALQACLAGDAAALATAYQAGELPGAAQRAIDAFLENYGMRGLAEIDLGRPRWREAPAPLLEAVRSYLRIGDAAQSPAAVFARGEAAAKAALAEQVAAARRKPAGALRARLVPWLYYRLRALVGLRESPKFTIIRIFDALRRALLDAGAALVARGYLDRAEDIAFLHLNELRGGPRRSWPATIATRRAAYGANAPPAGSAPAHGGWARLLRRSGRNRPGPAPCQGSPVSPGVVEGRCAWCSRRSRPGSSRARSSSARAPIPPGPRCFSPPAG